MNDMSKPIPAIIESEHETAFAAVRARYSELREAESQVERTAKRAADATRIASTAVVKRDEIRLALGLALLKARAAWPERGPKAKGWGEFLEREGIEQSTAWRLMEAAMGSVPERDGFHAAGRLHEIPHPAEVPDGEPAIAPSGRKPLGMLSDMQLLLGRWEDVLSRQEIATVDTIITDPPYSARTHAKSRDGARMDEYDSDGLAPDYVSWSPTEINAFVDAWAPRCRGWMVALTDHHLLEAWATAYERHDRYAFAPVPCVIQGMSVRLAGDGPSSWTVYAMVSRPRSLSKWGTLDGAYTGGREPGSKSGRGKPRWLTDALVRDYSREGDLVCDPMAGYGTTLVSALLQRRRAIGAEMDEQAVKEAFARADALNQPAA